jgi:hypothetical protein
VRSGKAERTVAQLAYRYPVKKISPCVDGVRGKSIYIAGLFACGESAAGRRFSSSQLPPSWGRKPLAQEMRVTCFGLGAVCGFPAADS